MEAGRIVEEETLIDVVIGRTESAGRRVEEGAEAETVAELVKEHGHQVELGAMEGIQAVVPVPAGQAARVDTDAAVEDGHDVVRSGVVGAGRDVGEGQAV